MTLAPSKDKYDAYLVVTRTPFSRRDYVFASAPDKNEAVRRCKAAASDEGWQPPAWWQWWRRKDTREPIVQPCSGL